MWDIASTSECDSVDFDAASDQRWVVAVQCRHGKWHAESGGPMDVSTAFEAVLAKFREAHRQLGTAGRRDDALITSTSHGSAEPR